MNILAATDPSISGVNNTDEEGWAPLHSSASCGHVEIVQILLSRGEISYIYLCSFIFLYIKFAGL